MTPLFEQYRPRQWSEVVGQSKAVAEIQRIASRGIGGRAWFISGKSGQGKTSIAYLIAGEIASRENVQELDAGALTVSAIKEIESGLNYYGMGQKSGRALIVNEAHALRRDVVNQFLVFLERLPGHATVIFTTTSENLELFEDCNVNASPLLSRCSEITLSSRDVARPMAERLKWGAERENLDGQPVEAYVKLLYGCGNNMRRAWQEIEAGVMLK